MNQKPLYALFFLLILAPAGFGQTNEPLLLQNHLRAVFIYSLETALEELKQHPLPTYKKPAYPNYRAKP